MSSVSLVNDKKRKSMSIPQAAYPLSSNKATCGNDNAVVTTVMDHNVLRLLIHSHNLTSKDIGRLLLLTSKQTAITFISAMADGDDDDNSNDKAAESAKSNMEIIWKTLCVNYWNDNGMVEKLRTFAGVSYEELFRTMAYPTPAPQTQGEETIAPPKYGPSDYGIIVQVKQANTGKFMFCETIRGENVPQFFVDGMMDHRLATPIDTGVAFDWDLLNHYPQSLQIYQNYLQDPESIGVVPQPCILSEPLTPPWWIATVHLVRKQSNGKQQVLPLAEICQGDALAMIQVAENGDVALGTHNVRGFCRVNPWGLTSKAYPLMKENGSFMRIMVRVYLTYSITASTGGSTSANVHNVAISGLTLSGLLEHGDGALGRLLEGPWQFAHLLEAIDAWNNETED